MITSLFFLGVGCYVLAYGAYLLHRGMRARVWPTVAGEIARHRIVAHAPSDAGADYEAVVAYRYSVAGQPFIAERVAFSPAARAFASRGALADAAHDRPVGERVVVSYNPADPGDAVLRPGPQPLAWMLALAGTLLLMAGVARLLGVAG